MLAPGFLAALCHTVFLPIGFYETESYSDSHPNKNQKSRTMTSSHEPKSTGDTGEPEFEITDGGWDPYVTSLLMGGSTQSGTESDDDAGDADDGAPVMSFSRRPATNSR
jgi:hypothetical protein